MNGDKHGRWVYLIHSRFYDYNFMKRTIREFGECRGCDGKGAVHGEITVCNVCRGSGREIIKETIEESDDMKEFIENKLGWKYESGMGGTGNYKNPNELPTNTVGPDYYCTEYPYNKVNEQF